MCVELPPAQLPAADAAIAKWSAALYRWKRLVPVHGRHEPCSFYVHEGTNGPPNILARASVLGGKEITMYRGWYEFDTQGILLHELGHALGAQHVANSLMNPKWVKNLYVCPDLVTVVQVAAWNDVDLEQLSWCY